MCSSEIAGALKSVGDLFGAASGGATGLGKQPDNPRVKKPPKVDLAEQERRAAEAERIRRVRAASGFSFFDSRLTGPLGVTSFGGSGGGQQKKLLGS